MAFRARWGDDADVEGDDEEIQMEEFRTNVEVFGPDAKGIKTIVEHKVREDGAKVKVVTKIRISKQKKKVSKAVSERRKWAKFGDAKNESRNDNISAVSVEQVFLEKPVHGASKKKDDAGDPLAALANQNASLLVCRICGKKGDHWTSKCPYKDLAAAKGMATGERPPGEDGESMLGAPKSGSYVPPSMRGGGGGGAGGG
eukprot:CAMPEP_0198212412 /NCGR_PEP_ID=MMETSP1445-20131203/25955_1 /TAXON_ID=36898 /ORGANISM="Pyramimonas sp., Strain CCMP2087" /LENGTH=199 /DNA_ID=CAMNT_0043886845 /DNA_START=110 /DNA_END=705 /DNA_ORIENTATION=-